MKPAAAAAPATTPVGLAPAAFGDCVLELGAAPPVAAVVVAAAPAVGRHELPGYAVSICRPDETSAGSRLADDGIPVAHSAWAELTAGPNALAKLASCDSYESAALLSEVGIAVAMAHGLVASTNVFDAIHVATNVASSLSDGWG